MMKSQNPDQTLSDKSEDSNPSVTVTDDRIIASVRLSLLIFINACAKALKKLQNVLVPFRDPLVLVVTITTLLVNYNAAKVLYLGQMGNKETGISGFVAAMSNFMVFSAKYRGSNVSAWNKNMSLGLFMSAAFCAQFCGSTLIVEANENRTFVPLAAFCANTALIVTFDEALLSFCSLLGFSAIAGTAFVPLVFMIIKNKLAEGVMCGLTIAFDLVAVFVLLFCLWNRIASVKATIFMVTTSFLATLTGFEFGGRVSGLAIVINIACFIVVMIYMQSLNSRPSSDENRSSLTSRPSSDKTPSRSKLKKSESGQDSPTQQLSPT